MKLKKVLAFTLAMGVLLSSDSSPVADPQSVQAAEISNVTNTTIDIPETALHEYKYDEQNILGLKEIKVYDNYLMFVFNAESMARKKEEETYISCSVNNENVASGEYTWAKDEENIYISCKCEQAENVTRVYFGGYPPFYIENFASPKLQTEEGGGEIIIIISQKYNSNTKQWLEEETYEMFFPLIELVSAAEFMEYYQMQAGEVPVDYIIDYIQTYEIEAQDLALDSHDKVVKNLFEADVNYEPKIWNFYEYDGVNLTQEDDFSDVAYIVLERRENVGGDSDGMRQERNSVLDIKNQKLYESSDCGENYTTTGKNRDVSEQEIKLGLQELRNILNEELDEPEPVKTAKYDYFWELHIAKKNGTAIFYWGNTAYGEKYPGLDQWCQKYLEIDNTLSAGNTDIIPDKPETTPNKTDMTVDNTEKSETLQVTVSQTETTPQKVLVEKLKIKGRKTMKRKKKQTLKLSITPANATSQAVEWKSSNKKIATVNSKGKVKAKKTGIVKITAAAKDGSGKKAIFKIRVK